MLKVVIVDDEKMICSLISQLLDWEELGAKIVGMAYTGTEALEMIQEQRPDIIISDIRMPGYDGLELIKRTKEAGIESEFVMISGFKQFEYCLLYTSRTAPSEEGNRKLARKVKNQFDQERR